jgi:hypothetical protein
MLACLIDLRPCLIDLGVIMIVMVMNVGVPVHCCQLRPYTAESTGSRPIPEVKQLLAQSVLRWETTREYCVS